MQRFDVIVIGGGMAGASIGAELARDRRVVLLEMEPTLAYHTTGRSAAMFLESYGGPTIRALTTGSRAHLEEHGVLTPLPMLHIGRAGRAAAIEALYDEVRLLVPDVELLEPDEAVTRQPLLRPGTFERALLEPGAMEIDVHALHQHFVHEFRAQGGRIVSSAPVDRATRANRLWMVEAAGGQWQAPVVVDAAGAWGDAVARMFGAAPVGLRALRRSAFMVDAPPDARAPMIADLDDAFYVKPDAGRLLCSPADETEQEPGDAKPDELEIARAIEVINEVTTLAVRHVRSAWAGLRTFVPDRSPVVGFDPEAPGFFWYAAQGGYGIQTAPALARTGAALLRGEVVAGDCRAMINSSASACLANPSR